MTPWMTNTALASAVIAACVGAAALTDPTLDENALPTSSTTIPAPTDCRVSGVCWEPLPEYSHPVKSLQGPAALEDENNWDCRVDGNRICGPRNNQDVAPGCYNDVGILVSGWPCHVVTLPNGEQDVYSDPQGSR